MRLSHLVLVAALSLCACAAKEVAQDDTTGPEPLSGATQPSVTPATAASPQSVGTLESRFDALQDPDSPLAKRSIYFNFEESLVKPEYRPLLEAHARYLSANRGAQVRVEGNTDERGTREFNLSLGSQRAEAVRKLLLLLGATDLQVEAVSLGEEKPRGAGHDEEAWAVNRRADIVYVRPR